MSSVWFASTVALFALALAALVVVRSPLHPAHWSFALGTLFLVAESVVGAMGGRRELGDDCLEWAKARLCVAAFLPGPWLTFSLGFSRGDYRETLRRWRSLLALTAIAPPLFAVVTWNELAGPALIPTSVASLARLEWAGYALELLLLLTAVLVLTNLERTFRNAVGLLRWRIKYAVLSVGGLFAFRFYASSQAILYRSADVLLGSIGAAAILVACLLMSVSIVRTRAFDLDVYPSHSFVFGSITVLIAGAYLLVVGLLSNALSAVGMGTDLPLKTFTLTVALSGLAVLLLSERVRRRIRFFVSRHLHRPLHDHRAVWSTLTRHITSVVDEEAYCRAVTTWVSETFSSLAVGLWLVDEHGEQIRLAASSATGPSGPDHPSVPTPEVSRLVAALTRTHEPIDIEASDEPWMVTLRALQPNTFVTRAGRVAAPLHAVDRLIGFIIAGDRVGGAPFTPEDFDLLKCAGDQIAAGLFGLRLSRQLVRAKEMEAFQTMSAFFVHDLKNTASTLSLTLRNLQQHFGDPAFRDDALRAVGKSVQHLNDLIARLSRLRQELRVQPVPTDLAKVVDDALTAAGSDSRIAIHRDFAAIPKVLADAHQLEKVVVNLVLNARDAMNGRGNLRLSIQRQDDWGVLSVADDGCGMTPEFVRQSLFRPFQTTKSNGLGIGMFHSRMIVDAHRGRLEVDSQPGRGTTFSISLPLAPNHP